MLETEFSFCQSVPLAGTGALFFRVSAFFASQSGLVAGVEPGHSAALFRGARPEFFLGWRRGRMLLAGWVDGGRAGLRPGGSGQRWMARRGGRAAAMRRRSYRLLGRARGGQCAVGASGAIQGQMPGFSRSGSDTAFGSGCMTNAKQIGRAHV